MPGNMFAALKFEPWAPINGVRAIVEFPNGWAVSVIKGEHSYGGRKGLYELAVKHGGDLHYTNPVADGDVCGHLTEDDVSRLMAKVAEFSADVKAVEDSYQP